MTSVYPKHSSPILSDFSGSEFSSTATDPDSPLCDFDPFIIPHPNRYTPNVSLVDSTSNIADIAFASPTIRAMQLPCSQSSRSSLLSPSQPRSTIGNQPNNNNNNNNNTTPNGSQFMISIPSSDVTVPSFRFESERERELKVVKSVAKRSRRFACTADGCGKSFAKKWNLQAHERLHSGYKPFECRIGCGERHMWMSSLKSHERRKCKLLPESQRLRRKPRAKKSTIPAPPTQDASTISAPAVTERQERRGQAPSNEALFDFELELENIIAKY